MSWLRKWKKQEAKAKENWGPYIHRNKVLGEIGFGTYAEYLASPLWREIRAKRLLTQNTCSCCTNTAIVLHHANYYRKLLLGDEKSVKRDLYPLCTSCHRKVEFDGQRKRSWGESSRLFGRMLFKFRHGMSKHQMILKKRTKS